jgi:hypothetical protein
MSMMRFGFTIEARAVELCVRVMVENRRDVEKGRVHRNKATISASMAMNSGTSNWCRSVAVIIIQLSLGIVCEDSRMVGSRGPVMEFCLTAVGIQGQIKV